jgi:hypothetical protein
MNRPSLFWSRVKREQSRPVPSEPAISLTEIYQLMEEEWPKVLAERDIEAVSEPDTMQEALDTISSWASKYAGRAGTAEQTDSE